MIFIIIKNAPTFWWVIRLPKPTIYFILIVLNFEIIVKIKFEEKVPEITF